MAKGRYLGRRHKYKTFNGGGSNKTLNSTNWASLDALAPATTTDVILDAEVGDTLVANFNGVLGNQTPDAYFDVCTIIAAARVNSFAKKGAVQAAPGVAGVPAWYVTGSVFGKPSGAVMYEVVAGDLDANGLVTCRIYYATSTATNRTFYCDGTTYLPEFSVQNIGPVDPY